MSKSFIELQNLSRQFVSHAAINQLSLQIEKGEVFDFLGHNGAGKTITIHMLTTLLPPSAGSAFIGGHNIETETLAVRQLIGGYVPEIACADKLVLQTQALKTEQTVVGPK